MKVKKYGGVRVVARYTFLKIYPCFSHALLLWALHLLYIVLLNFPKHIHLCCPFATKTKPREFNKLIQVSELGRDSVRIPPLLN